MPSNDTLLALTHPLVALLVGTLLIGCWRMLGRPPPLLRFGAAFGCYAVGLVMQILLWPAHQGWNIFLSGALYILSSLFFANGMVALAQRRLPAWPAAAILSATMGLRTWAALEPVHFLLRAGPLYLGVSLLFFLALWQMRHWRRGMTLERFFFWFLFVGTCTFVPRVMLTGASLGTSYGYDGSLYWVLTQVSFYVVTVGSAILALLLAALHAMAHLNQAAERDPLTGLRNRAGLSTFTRETLAGVPCYGLVMIDVDHFKSVNERFGHPVGDAVLRTIAQLVAQQVGSAEAAGRFGGEEFMLVLPGAGPEEAARIAERVRAAVQAHDFSAAAPGLHCTVSAGAGSFAGALPFAEAYRAVDGRLAQAKRGGRNRVCVSAAPPPPATSESTLQAHPDHTSGTPAAAGATPNMR
ncbi:GGDEF domain-containing protein [Verticiella sediminum]|uniref:diguanylate cyclase n=1 Tax=Verticiella sediminum TaxID=1247510 RepID=A0A556AY38_9BURK|nr:GGDEF domain-containing protein [Verticiella sediminum]TSH97385.1 GGDEF domain-containing protein [Verticiella sediminum]